MSYKNILLDVIRLFLSKKMSYKQIDTKFGNWNFKETREPRMLFIKNTVFQLQDLINVTHKFHNKDIDVKEYRIKLAEIFNKEEV